MPPHRTLVAGHDLKFFRVLRQALEETELFEFREDVWTGHDSHDEERSLDLLDWAEIIIAEWCLGNAVWYSRHKRKGQRLFCRFHLQERTTDFPNRVDLAAIDRIAFVGAHIEREAHERLGIPPSKTCVIPNIVDVDAFDLPKLDGAIFNLGITGIAPRRKRVDLALDLLERLLKADDRYTLRIKGQHPTQIDWLWARTAERRYYVEQLARMNCPPLRNRVLFDPAGPDVPHWLRTVGFVLSPSDFESFHMAVAEGLAAGSHPVVWRWDGAEEIYGSEHIVDSVEHAAERIEEIRCDSSRGERIRRGRRLLRDRFDRAVIRDAWLSLLLPDYRGAPATVPLTDRRDRSDRRKRPLVVVYAIDDWSTFHRREMLTELAARTEEAVDLLVIEPGSHAGTVLRLGWETRESLTRLCGGEPARVAANLWRFRSLVSGFPNGVPRPADLADDPDEPELLRRRIDEMFPGRSRVLHWLYKPDQVSRWLRKSDNYVYECYDDYTRDFSTGEPLAEVARQEHGVLQGASTVFFTSEPLEQAKGSLARRRRQVGNGVSYSVFARFRERAIVANDSLSVGYLGNMARFFDWKTMATVCNSMPKVRFRFHGPVELRPEDPEYEWYTELRALENCDFSGRVSREEGAERISTYSVLAIPFLRNEAMEAVNPLKLWEYFAAGRPVVSTPMKAIAALDGLVYFATSPDTWREAILAAAAEDDPDLQRRRIEVAEAHAWPRIVDGYWESLRETIAEL